MPKIGRDRNTNNAAMKNKETKLRKIGHFNQNTQFRININSTTIR
jgi:hypothetical protein